MWVTSVFNGQFSYVYLFLRERGRERACTSGGGAEREARGRGFEAGSSTDSREPDAGLELMNSEITT